MHAGTAACRLGGLDGLDGLDNIIELGFDLRVGGGRDAFPKHVVDEQGQELGTALVPVHEVLQRGLERTAEVPVGLEGVLSTTIGIEHRASSTIIINYHHQLSSSTIIINYHTRTRTQAWAAGQHAAR